jgi:hypothetical protein
MRDDLTGMWDLKIDNKISAEAALVLAIAREVIYPAKTFSLQDKDHDAFDDSCQKQGSEVLSLLKKSNINWSKFKDSLAYHGLAPFAHLSFKGHLSLIPQDVAKILEATFYFSLKRVLRFEQEFLDLYSTFEKNGITFLPFKGMALLEDLYTQYAVRPSADIDVLVQEEDVDAAISLLENSGFDKELEGLKESYWRKQYHMVFIKRRVERLPVLVELHWDLDYPRKSKLLPEKFNRLRDILIRGRRVKTLSVEDTFFGLALHQRRFGQVLNLRDVCDMARLLNKYASTFDWAYVIRESRTSKLCSTIFFALYQMDFFFRVNIPDHVWKELNPSRFKKRLIRHFIENDTFLENQDSKIKNLYLKAHFLLYNNFWEPLEYIFNIPKEQFAKYYGLDSSAKITMLLHNLRFAYIPLQSIWQIVVKRGADCEEKKK